MSLINDALKRVKEAQHKAPPSASLGPQLRPVEPVAVPAHHGLGWVLPIALTGVALLTLLLLWELSRRESSPARVRAQATVQEPSSSANDSSKTTVGSTEATQPVGSSIQEASVTPGAPRSISAASPPPSNSAISTSNTNSALSAPAKSSPALETLANTNAVQAADGSSEGGNTNSTTGEVQPPKPAPLKLQGIVFSKRPSAVINGKTLFIGDRVREFRVAAITQDTAILVGAGRTNVLSLSE